MGIKEDQEERRELGELKDEATELKGPVLESGLDLDTLGCCGHQANAVLQGRGRSLAPRPHFTHEVGVGCSLHRRWGLPCSQSSR